MADKEIQSYADLTPSNQTKVFALNPGDLIGWVDYPENAQSAADVAATIEAHDLDVDAHLSIRQSIDVVGDMASANDSDIDDINVALQALVTEVNDHLNATSNAHPAEAVSVLDTGSFYADDNVEDILQDVASKISNVNAQIASLGTGALSYLDTVGDTYITDVDGSKIDNNSVARNKLQTSPPMTVLGNPSAGQSNVTTIPIADLTTGGVGNGADGQVYIGDTGGAAWGDPEDLRFGDDAANAYAQFADDGALAIINSSDATEFTTIGHSVSNKGPYIAATVGGTQYVLLSINGTTQETVLGAANAPVLLYGDEVSAKATDWSPFMATQDYHVATKQYTDSRIWKGTQAAYDALTPDPDVLYVITG